LGVLGRVLMALTALAAGLAAWAWALLLVA
jgi:hypothetical protein